MRVLVSGSHGLIGAALVRRLSDAGHEIKRLVRSGGGPGTVTWDPAHGTLDRAALGGIEAAVHLAGEGIGSHRWSRAHKARVFDSRVAGTALLATSLASLDQPPAVLVSGSAVGVYGDRGGADVTEDDEPGTGFLSEVCLAWEGATAAAEEADIRVVHTRTGVVMARDGGALAKQLPLFRFGLGGRLGSGRQFVSWISLEDELRAIEFVLTRADVRGPVNLTAPEPVTNREFTRVLARVLHRPALVPVPRFALAAVMGREMADEMLLAGAKVLPSRLLAAGFEFRHADLEAALRAELAASG